MMVEVVAAALQRLDPSSTVLTSLHISLVQAAYHTRCYDQVLPIIENNVLYFAGDVSPPKHLCSPSLAPNTYISYTTGLSQKLLSTDVLEYGLVRSLVFIAKRQWEKAFDALACVISHPTSNAGVSKIMVEAFKKWLLVSLILHGKLPALPSYTSKAAEKAYPNMAQQYIALEAVFNSPDIFKLQHVKAMNMPFWSQDRNEGLVDEVMAAYQKWQIVNLRQIYCKISISEIRQQTKSAATGQCLDTDDAVAALLQPMIESGMLAGTLERPASGPAHHLVFLSDAQKPSNS